MFNRRPPAPFDDVSDRPRMRPYLSNERFALARDLARAPAPLLEAARDDARTLWREGVRDLEKVIERWNAARSPAAERACAFLWNELMRPRRTARADSAGEGPREPVAKEREVAPLLRGEPARLPRLEKVQHFHVKSLARLTPAESDAAISRARELNPRTAEGLLKDWRAFAEKASARYRKSGGNDPKDVAEHRAFAVAWLAVQREGPFKDDKHREAALGRAGAPSLDEPRGAEVARAARLAPSRERPEDRSLAQAVDYARTQDRAIVRELARAAARLVGENGQLELRGEFVSLTQELLMRPTKEKVQRAVVVALAAEAPRVDALCDEHRKMPPDEADRLWLAAEERIKALPPERAVEDARRAFESAAVEATLARAERLRNEAIVAALALDELEKRHGIKKPDLDAFAVGFVRNVELPPVPRPLPPPESRVRKMLERLGAVAPKDDE